MKLTNKTLTWLVAGMVSIALVTGANAQTAKERTGKVVRIKGAARYSTGNKIWQPLKVGTILKSGAVVQTAADSYADIVIERRMPQPTSCGMPRASARSHQRASASGGGWWQPSLRSHDVIRVQKDSVLAIDRVSATDTGADRVTETELDLRTGSIFFSVKKQAAASRFEIKISQWRRRNSRNVWDNLRGRQGSSAAEARWFQLPPTRLARRRQRLFRQALNQALVTDTSPIRQFSAAALHDDFPRNQLWLLPAGGAPVSQRFEALGREQINVGRQTMFPDQSMN